MINKKQLTIKFGYSPYLSRDGSFFFYNLEKETNNGSYGCRESFEVSFHSNAKLIGFHGKNLNIKKLNEFFEYIEERIKLKDRTIFYYTSNVYTVIVQPARYWLQNPFTRGMLTMFLRCGGGYYDGDFDSALRQYRLTNDALPAIYRFLRGNTKLTKSISSGSTAETLSNLSGANLIKSLTGAKNDGSYENYMVSMKQLKLG